LKYKVGDKVRCITDRHPRMVKGEIGTISEIRYDLDEIDCDTIWWMEFYIKELKEMRPNFIYSAHVEKVDTQEQLEFEF
jgi:hypothetical protein